MRKYRWYTLLILYMILLISYGCARTFRYTLGCAEIKSDQSFTFFITSDLHYLSKELYDNGREFNEFLASGDGKLVQYSGELVDALVRDTLREKPDFLIITGDLTCNGEKKSHLELVEKLEAIEDAGTCVFVIPGNHDIQNPWARQYMNDDTQAAESITSEEYLKLYGRFGYDNAVSKDEHSLSYLAMPAEGTWLLMLDSPDFDRNAAKQYPEQGGSLPVQTLGWIEQCAKLAKENNARLIAVMHHSLIHHSEILNYNYTLSNSDELLKVFRKCGLEIILTGHIHLQDIKTDKHEGKLLYDIATSSLSVFPHQYGKMCYTPNHGFDYSTSMVDIGKWSRQQGLSDECLFNFEAYSAEFFTKQCGRMHQDCLSKLKELSVRDRAMVMETIDRMNMLYFAGYRNEALNGVVNTEGFRLLQKISPCFTKEYAMSMLNDEKTDNNKVFIPCSCSEDNDQAD